MPRRGRSPGRADRRWRATSAPNMKKRAEHGRGPRQARSRRHRAPNAAWLPLPPNAAAMSPPFTLLEEHDDVGAADRRRRRRSVSHQAEHRPGIIPSSRRPLRATIFGEAVRDPGRRRPRASRPRPAARTSEPLAFAGLHAAAIDDPASACRRGLARTGLCKTGVAGARAPPGPDRAWPSGPVPIAPDRLVGHDDRRGLPRPQ